MSHEANPVGHNVDTAVWPSGVFHGCVLKQIPSFVVARLEDEFGDIFEAQIPVALVPPLILAQLRAGSRFTWTIRQPPDPADPESDFILTQRDHITADDVAAARQRALARRRARATETLSNDV